MKKLFVLLAVLACAGCAGQGRYSDHLHENSDYKRNCGNAMDELLMCNGSYVSPHEF